MKTGNSGDCYLGVRCVEVEWQKINKSYINEYPSGNAPKMER